MRDGAGEHVHTGEYREIRPSERLVSTWNSSATAGRDTLVTVELRAQGKKTELILLHEWLPDASAAAKYAGGWQSIAEKLDLYFLHQ
jgi:uncharacterized protein YndB with AHSA1/START domain